MPISKKKSIVIDDEYEKRRSYQKVNANANDLLAIVKLWERYQLKYLMGKNNVSFFCFVDEKGNIVSPIYYVNWNK